MLTKCIARAGKEWSGMVAPLGICPHVVLPIDRLIESYL